MGETAHFSLATTPDLTAPKPRKRLRIGEIFSYLWGR